MPTSHPTILAINPGSRYLGIAVFKGSDLIDWGIKVMEGKWSPEKFAKALRVTSELISDYRPNVIVMKRLHPSRTSIHLNKLCRRFELLAQEQHLKISQYSIEEIKAFHARGRDINKFGLAELVSLKYPVMARIFRRESRSSNPYHVRMFEAVALGVTAAAKDK